MRDASVTSTMKMVAANPRVTLASRPSLVHVTVIIEDFVAEKGRIVCPYSTRKPIKGYIMGPFKDSPVNASINKETNVYDQSAYHNRDRTFTMGEGMEEIYKKVTSYYDPPPAFCIL